MISIQQAEQLKQELTGKYVVVADGVPELKRFAGLTGTVKTVNMNCRALVEFDGPEDIGWYDIDPSFLQVVDAPIKKKKPAAQPAAAASPATSKKAPAKKSAGMSPLEMARAQGAAKSGTASSAAESPPAKPAAEKSAGKKLSPLELARQQGAVKSGTASPAAEPPPTAEDTAEASAEPAADDSAGQKKAEIPTTGPDGKPLSKIELARLQGPFKG